MNNKEQRRSIEKLLGASLPKSAKNIHCQIWQPGENLLHYEVYINFALPKTDFDTFMRQIGLGKYKTNPAVYSHLPANWQTVPEVQLDWWVADDSTPDDSWAKDFGESGWIIAKYENGNLFMNVTDTGYGSNRSQTDKKS